MYDAGDRLRTIVDSSAGIITRDYDLLDRLTSETTPEGSISYTYDLDGRRETTTLAGQPTVTYEYDDAHRLTTITQSTTIVSMTYDDANRRDTLTLPNGIVATSGYDNANQVTGLTYTLGQTTLGTLTYTYEDAGNRTSVGGTWARTGLPQPMASATYDAAHRIATWAGTIFSYDASGNMASDGLTSYVWNARNQLTGLTGDLTASFAYDGLGRRRSRTLGGSTTAFLYDGPNVAQELAGGSAVANLLTGDADEVFLRTDAIGNRFLLADALGGTMTLTDGAAMVQTLYTYEPFGATAASGTTNPNPIQFMGRENDGTGLYFYRARYYDPQRQRFVSADPLGFAGGINEYEFVRSNPATFTDPFGLRICVGKVRVLGGNPNTIGKRGGVPGIKVAPLSAAVIPPQFGANNGAGLAPYAASISGGVPLTFPLFAVVPVFSGVTDVIGSKNVPAGYDNIRDWLQDQYPNQPIIELPSGKDMGSIPMMLKIPDSLRCPPGTREWTPCGDR